MRAVSNRIEAFSAGFFFGGFGGKSSGAPGFDNALSGSLSALISGLATEEATVAQRAAPIFEFLPAAVADLAGAQASYYRSSLFPPLDPYAPIFASTLTATRGGSLPEGGGAVTGEMALASGDGADGDLGPGGAGDLADDPSSAPLDGDATVALGLAIATSEDVVRVFNESEIAIVALRQDGRFANTRDGSGAGQAWIFDDVEGVFAPRTPGPLTIRIDAAAGGSQGAAAPVVNVAAPASPEFLARRSSPASTRRLEVV